MTGRVADGAARPSARPPARPSVRPSARPSACLPCSPRWRPSTIYALLTSSTFICRDGNISITAASLPACPGTDHLSLGCDAVRRGNPAAAWRPCVTSGVQYYVYDDLSSGDLEEFSEVMSVERFIIPGRNETFATMWLLCVTGVDINVYRLPGRHNPTSLSLSLALSLPLAGV